MQEDREPCKLVHGRERGLRYLASMSKALLFRLFGLGSLPEELKNELQTEGLLLWDEGLPMSLHYRRYKAPHMGATGRKGSRGGYVAVCQKRLVMKGHWEFSSVNLSEVSGDNLEYGIHKNGRFFAAFDASSFYSDRSGRIEHRFHTPIARVLVAQLDELLRR